MKRKKLEGTLVLSLGPSTSCEPQCDSRALHACMRCCEGGGGYCHTNIRRKVAAISNDLSKISSKINGVLYHKLTCKKKNIHIRVGWSHCLELNYVAAAGAAAFFLTCEEFGYVKRNPQYRSSGVAEAPRLFKNGFIAMVTD